MNSPTDRRHIAIYHTWPEIKNAEYEVILRIVAAARNIGIDVSVMDNDSYTIWSTNPSYNQEMLRIDHKNCDFAISLHFESPKTADIYTYATLWNPYEFYFLWGYDKSIVKLLSHDDLLTSGSKPAEAHALNLFQAIGRPVPTPLPELFPTLATILFEPNISKASRLFYIGINWERINATRGRHHDLLVALDEADMIDIYGPEIFLGVKPWEGFESYRGAIPFDGTTTIRKIAEAGICLAFSSAAHQRSEIMSSRLFEGLAAGALLISNKHAFVDRYFGDTVITIDDSQPPEMIIEQVKEAVRWARNNPELANAKARAAQKIFRDGMQLEQTLSKLMGEHDVRVAARRAPRAEVPSITGIIIFLSTKISRLWEMLTEAADQIDPPSQMIVVLDEALYGLFHRQFVSKTADLPFPVSAVTEELFEFSGQMELHTSRKRPIGPAVLRALGLVKTDLFYLHAPSDGLFSNHLSSLVATLTANPNHLAAGSGALHESKQAEGRLHRYVEGLQATPMEAYLFANQTRFTGQHLYRRAILGLLREPVFALLDGQEFNYLNILAILQGGIAQSQCATIVFRSYDFETTASPTVPLEQQHQFIRDAVRALPQRLEFLRSPKLPEIVFSTPAGVAVQWANQRRPTDVGAIAAPGQRYAIASDGEGPKFLQSGFAAVEGDGVWIEGRSAVLEFVIGIPARGWGGVRKIRFALEMMAPAEHASGRSQHVSLMVNGLLGGYFSVGSTWQDCVVDVSRDLLGDERAVRLRLILDHAEAGRDEHGGISDGRLRSARLRAITVTPDAASAQTVALPIKWPGLMRMVEPSAAGERVKGRIRSRPNMAGYVMSGPYLSIGTGSYRLTLETALGAATDDAFGRAYVEVVYGDVVIALAAIRPNGAPIILDFCVSEPWSALLTAAAFEIRLWADGTVPINILEMNLERTGPPGLAPLSGVPNWLPLMSVGGAGLVAGETIISSQEQAGCVFFGPYRALPAGDYRLVVALGDIVESGASGLKRLIGGLSGAKNATLRLEVALADGAVIAERRANLTRGAATLELPFTVAAKDGWAKLEMRLFKSAGAAFAVAGVRIDPIRLDRIAQEQSVPALS